MLRALGYITWSRVNHSFLSHSLMLRALGYITWSRVNQSLLSGPGMMNPGCFPCGKIERVFDSRSIKPKTYKIVIWCFYSKLAAFRSKTKEWLTRGVNQSFLSHSLMLRALGYITWSRVNQSFLSHSLMLRSLGYMHCGLVKIGHHYHLTEL
jgi:hypothetical protein